MSRNLVCGISITNLTICGGDELNLKKKFLNNPNGQAWWNDFQSFQSRDIENRARKPPQKFGAKEVAFKKYRKKYSTLLYRVSQK